MDFVKTSPNPGTVYDLLEKMGSGSYGAVWRAKNKQTGKIVAIKIIDIRENGDFDSVVKEIRFLADVDHPNVVKYYESYLIDHRFLWICMEFCGAGSVADVIDIVEHGLDEQQIKYVLSETLKGIGYLHANRKMHRDVKGGNILLTLEGKIKLGTPVLTQLCLLRVDFGVSAELVQTTQKRDTLTGTPYWMAPEVILQTRYDYRADLWSVGILGIELADMIPPLANIHPMRALFMIPQHPPPTVLDPKKWSPEFLDFLKFVLVKSPAQRPDAAMCLKHPFFKDTPGPDCIVKLLQKSEEIVKKRGFRIVDSSSDEESSDDDSSGDDDSQDSDGLESGDDGTDPDVDLGKLTIGADTLIKMEMQKKRGGNAKPSAAAESSDEESSDEGPQTVVISDISDLQNQLEIQRLKSQGVTQNTGATMRTPAAAMGAVQPKTPAALPANPAPATHKPKGSPAAAAAAAVVAAAGASKQPPPLPTSPIPSGPPPSGMKPKITVKQAAPRRVGRTLAMAKSNSSASLKKKWEMPPTQLVIIRFVVHCPTRFGQHVLLVGSCPELGSWTVGHRMTYFADDAGKWIHEITLPAESDKKFSYKYLLTEGLNAQWEDGANREFELLQEISGAIEVRDNWRLSRDPNTKPEVAPLLRLRGLNLKVQEGVSIVFRVQINQIVPVTAEVRLVGSTDELGAWDPEKGRVMDLVDGCFRAVVFLSDSKIPFQYKYVIRADRSNLKWETGDNRNFRAYQAGQLIAVSATMDAFRL